MEFPDLGEHCSLADCRKLDFLPIKCSGCKKIFCGTHFTFGAHKCPEANADDNQVPVCPLCNKPVPIKPGESPDYKVSQHIDSNCNTKREEVYKNRCSVAGCKKKELMPLTCESCGANHCLGHRHPTDHNCTGPRVPPNNNRSAAASRSKAFYDQFTRKTSNTFEAIRTNVSSTINNASRGNTSSNSPSRGGGASSGARQVPSNANAFQGDLTEEEALNIAIQESLASANGSNNSGNNGTNTAQKCRVS